jgi:hypothetical protein
VKNNYRKEKKLTESIGKKLGSWLVLAVSKDGKGLLCRCDCGIEKELHRNILYTPRNCQACYLRKQFGSNHRHWKGLKYIPASYWRNLSTSNRLRKKNIEFNLTIEEAEAKFIEQEYKCALSGMPISFLDKTASLDRIDSSKNYCIDNIQWVHKTVNKMKTDLDQEEFLYFCKQIGNYGKGENRKE